MFTFITGVETCNLTGMTTAVAHEICIAVVGG